MSKKWWIVIIVVSSILSLVLAGELFIYFRNRQIIANKPKQEIILTPPEELTTNFDPVENAPRFMIESTNVEAKSLTLKFVWPHTSEIFESNIVCQDGDIKIASKSSQTPEDITLDALFEKVQDTSKELMIFSGLCSDKTCLEINEGCHLYVGL